MRAPPESFRPDDRRAVAHRHVHHLADLGGVGFRQRAAEHREVLRERIHHAAVDLAVAADDAVAGDDLLFHPEVLAAMRDELVDFLERAGIEQQRHALAGGQLALRVMLLLPLVTAAELGQAFAFFQSLDRIHKFRNATATSRSTRRNTRRDENWKMHS